MLYCLDRVPAVVKEKPALAKVEPFKTVLTGDFRKIVKLSLHDLEEILAVTLTGMDVTRSTPNRRPGWTPPRIIVRIGSTRHCHGAGSLLAL